MRKLLMSLFVLAGIMFAGTIPASANAASGLTSAKIAVPQGQVTEARWRHHRRGFYFGFGYPSYGYGYYPRYYGYGYYPRHRYYGYGYRHRGWGWRHHRHNRHWRRW